MTSRRLLVALALAATGCNALLGLDFDPTAAPAADGGEDPGAVGDATLDASAARDAVAEAATEAPTSAGDGGLDTEQTRLAALRVRIGDAPPGDGQLTSSAWLYWSTPAWRGQRVPFADARTFAFPLVAATDTHVATGTTVQPVTLRSADTGQSVASFPRDGIVPVAVDEGVLFFPDAASAIDALLWKPSSPSTRTKIGTLATLSATVAGRAPSQVLLRDMVTVGRLWVADAKAVSVTSVTTTVAIQHADRTDDGIVVTHVAGADTLFRLVAPPAPDVDLTAEIAAASCIVPPSERGALGVPVAFGPWLIFSSRSGLLAYRHGDKRLVPLQIRTSTDGYVFNFPGVVRASRTLVFSLSSPQGLYTLPLDAVLP